MQAVSCREVETAVRAQLKVGGLQEQITEVNNDISTVQH
jgi:hypothetical protein